MVLCLLKRLQHKNHTTKCSKLGTNQVSDKVMIEVLLLPYSSAVTPPRAWCLKINFLVFINLLHTHTQIYIFIALPIFIPSSAVAETFVTTQFHFLAEAPTGSKGKMGIQQLLSSPIQFHL